MGGTATSCLLTLTIMPSWDGLVWPVAEGTATALTIARILTHKTIFIILLLKQFEVPVRHPLKRSACAHTQFAQNGKRTERIQRWLSRWNWVAAICRPPP